MSMDADIRSAAVDAYRQLLVCKERWSEKASAEALADAVSAGFIRLQKNLSEGLDTAGLDKLPAAQRPPDSPCPPSAGPGAEQAT